MISTLLSLPLCPLCAKVTVNYYEEEGNIPIDQAGLFLTAIGELAWLWPGSPCAPEAGTAALSTALGLFSSCRPGTRSPSE